ncbi:MAG: serine/threonine-protein kinase [bacterium]|nr:serine/threonine-protein kinase [bacterium]MDD2941818.1 serine/threonine-protein kinase [bacterium]
MTIYTFRENKGRGAFGQVDHFHTDTWGDVAVKKFDPSPEVLNAIKSGYISEEELKRRFHSEATYQAKLAHPNVVRIFESNLTSTPPFFVMELAECTLAKDLASDHTLGGAPNQALFDILAGLEWIHSQGIYHRDLKPQNILRLRNPDGTYRYALSDFGLIKVTTGDSTTLTATGTQGGTERYAAPELISNFKRATARSDVFSFGVLLYDIFVGPTAARVPYTETNFAGAVGTVASKCTKLLPARRFSSIAEVRAALYEAMQSEVLKFGSEKEEQIVELLHSGKHLDDQEWDSVFLLLEDLDENSSTLDLVLRAFSKDHLEALHTNAPDLLTAFSGYYIDYVNIGRGKFNFDYCDVIADKLTWLFEFGDVGVRASSLIAMLGLGTSHNRWFVERRFANLAGPTLDTPTAERILLEIEVRDLKLLPDIEHLEWSISISRSSLNPVLQKIWIPVSA